MTHMQIIYNCHQQQQRKQKVICVMLLHNSFSSNKHWVKEDSWIQMIMVQTQKNTAFKYQNKNCVRFLCMKLFKYFCPKVREGIRMGLK
jgi:hypothetical protein